MDDIQKILRGTGEVLAKIFSGKELRDDFFTQIQFLEPNDIHAKAEELVHAGKLSEAEDFLFSNLEVNYTPELFYLGQELIEKILAYDDARLEGCGYSRDEVLKWQADWAALYVELDGFDSGVKQAAVFPKKKKKKGKKGSEGLEVASEKL